MSVDDSCPGCSEYKGTTPDIFDWIKCDCCKEWYHLHCIELDKDVVPNIVKYYCPYCSLENKDLESILKRTSKRRKTEINYVALNDGDMLNSIKNSSDIVHPYIKLFQDWEPSDLTDESNVIEFKGADLNLEYAMKTKIPRPVKINAADRNGLGLFIPEFTLDELTNDLEDDYELEVMNVLTQENIRMTMKEWNNYFSSNSDDRDKVLNVLSLEISHCDIGKSIKRPKIVEDVDLVDKIWPNDETKPKVSKYCLMGIKNSYTDFHLDFAGTSVYYTILKGSKQFIFFPPTESNLKKYYKWTINQSDNGGILNEANFLPNCGLEKGIKVELNKDDVLIIPSGWIHGVWTPEDTIVIGGNFLTCFNIDTQLKIIELERLTKVEKKFKFPKFNRLMVLTVLEILKNDDQDSNIKLDKDIDFKSCENLYKFLIEILNDKQMIKENSINKTLIGNKAKFLEKFKTFIEVNKIKQEDEQVKTEQVVPS